MAERARSDRRGARACRGLDPIELEERPRTQRCAHAKRLAIWVWVHEYARQQIEVARALALDTGVVSRYYGQAIAAAGESCSSAPSP